MNFEKIQSLLQKKVDLKSVYYISLADAVREALNLNQFNPNLTPSLVKLMQRLDKYSKVASYDREKLGEKIQQSLDEVNRLFKNFESHGLQQTLIALRTQYFERRKTQSDLVETQAVSFISNLDTIDQLVKEILAEINAENFKGIPYLTISNQLFALSKLITLRLKKNNLDFALMVYDAESKSKLLDKLKELCLNLFRLRAWMIADELIFTKDWSDMSIFLLSHYIFEFATKVPYPVLSKNFKLAEASELDIDLHTVEPGMLLDLGKTWMTEVASLDLTEEEYSKFLAENQYTPEERELLLLANEYLHIEEEAKLEEIIAGAKKLLAIQNLVLTGDQSIQNFFSEES